MTLSVLCPTRESGPRVRAVLGALREVADEIVVAADSRVEHADLAYYAAASDRLLRYEHAGPDRGQAFLHECCHGDWVLMIAGDEVPSATLVDRLRELTSRRDVLQYWLPTRWLYPDGDHWLNELPWWPDFHNRLVRNDGTLWFPGAIHTAAAAARPACYLTEPLYHLDCALTSLDHRTAKAAHYEQIAPGLRAPGGGPLNQRYFLPELHARLAPERVPSADRPAIAAALNPPTGGVLPVRGEVPIVGRGEVLRRWSGRHVPEGAYRARLAPIGRDHRMHQGERRPVHVSVTNLGCEHWPWAAPEHEPNIRVAYRWRDQHGRLIVPEGGRTPFPHSVAPQETCVVPVLVDAPPIAGTHVLELDLVHEHVRWFGCELRLPMHVAAGV